MNGSSKQDNNQDLRLKISVIDSRDDGLRDVELVKKTLQFPTQVTVQDACVEIRNHISEFKCIGQPIQYGLFLPDLNGDRKKGVWLEPGRTFEHYLLRDNNEIEYRKKMRLLRVKMLDGSVKSLMVDDSQVVANLMVLICTKIGLTNHDEYSLIKMSGDGDLNDPHTLHRSHSIANGGVTGNNKENHGYGGGCNASESQPPAAHQSTMNRLGSTLSGTMKRRGKSQGSLVNAEGGEIDPKMEELKRQLNTEDGVNWIDQSKTLREQGITPSDVVLLKRKYFYSDGSVDKRDPVQLNLLYEQAREGIIDGTHPIRLDDAVRFASLQLQIQFGDHRESSHRPGMLDLREFLPLSYMKVNKIEKKIFTEHKSLVGMEEIEAKLQYVKLARALPTFGVHFFLVKEKMRGRNRLVPRLIGITKDSVLRLDEKTKEILKTWPLTTVRRWAASPNVFTLDFGDYQDQYYSVQTTEGEQISQLIAGYIDIILKRRQRKKERIGDTGNEEEAMEEDIVTPGRAITLIGMPTSTEDQTDNKVREGCNRMDREESVEVKTTVYHHETTTRHQQHHLHHNSSPSISNLSYDITTTPRDSTCTQDDSNQIIVEDARKQVRRVTSESERSLITTITEGQNSISQAEQMLCEKVQLPPLDKDPASQRWKETQRITSKQQVHSRVSAMNAATAQMVTLTGQGNDKTDFNAVGTAVNTISTNLPEMARGVKMLAAIMDCEESDGHQTSSTISTTMRATTDNNVYAVGENLMNAARQLCVAFSDLLEATEPHNEPRQYMLTAASQVGTASCRVLNSIGPSEHGEEVEKLERERQDGLLALAKGVANTTAALVLKAKNVASDCTDQTKQNKVIGAATQCALGTSQLVACAKVVAPTLSHTLCQEQLVCCANQVSRSVDHCVETCKDVVLRNSSYSSSSNHEDDDNINNEALLTELTHSASDVSHALNDLLSHVSSSSSANTSTYGGGLSRSNSEDKIPEIMDEIMVTSQDLMGCESPPEMVRKARMLAQCTAELIQAIKGEAERQGNSGIQKSLLSAAKELADATSSMVEAAKTCATTNSDNHPQNEMTQIQLKESARNLTSATQVAASTTLRRIIITRLEAASKHAAVSATQCIASSQSVAPYNSSQLSQDKLMESCKAVASVVPQMVECAKMSMHNPDNSAAQLNLITSAEHFFEPVTELLEGCREAAPTIDNASSLRQLTNSAKQLDMSCSDLEGCINKSHQYCANLEIEASVDIIDSLQHEIEEFKSEANSTSLRQLPGQNQQTSTDHLNGATRSVGSNIAQLLRAVTDNDQNGVNKAARDTSIALKDYTCAVRNVAAMNHDNKYQMMVLDSAQLVMARSAQLVLQVQRSMAQESSVNGYSSRQSPFVNRPISTALIKAGKDVSEALNNVINCVPGHVELNTAIDKVERWFSLIGNQNHVPTVSHQHDLQKLCDSLNDTMVSMVTSVRKTQSFAKEDVDLFCKNFDTFMENCLYQTSKNQQSSEDMKSNIVDSLRYVASSASTFFTSVKDSLLRKNSGGNKYNDLQASARDLEESMHNMVSLSTSCRPGLKECDVAIRDIQSSYNLLENVMEPVSEASYFECLEMISERSKALGTAMTGIANHAKHGEFDDFDLSIKSVAEAIRGLVETAAQSAYLVGVSDAGSQPGKRGLVDQSQFFRAHQAIRAACQTLCDPNSGQQHILTSATIIAKHTSSLCNSCRMASTRTEDQNTKRHFVQSAKEVANATATLVKEIKKLDLEYSNSNRHNCSLATVPLLEHVESLCQFAASPNFASTPSKISLTGRKSQEQILQSGKSIIDGSCMLIESAKELVINQRDPQTWQYLASSSKQVSDSIKSLVSSLRDRAPGQKECDEAINKLTNYLRKLDQTSLDLINQEGCTNQRKSFTELHNDVRQSTEQIENAANLIKEKVSDVAESAKYQAERMGHAVAGMSTYFDPLVSHIENSASYMTSSKQQVMYLDLTKNVIESALHLMYSARESGGNSKAVHVHREIDDNHQSLDANINELIETINKIAPSIGVVSKLMNCITESIHVLDDYTNGNYQHDVGNETFIELQGSMTSATKEIARASQDIVIKSSFDAEQLGEMSSHLALCFKKLSSDAMSVMALDNRSNTSIKSAVQNLGWAGLELVKSTGTSKLSPSHDKYAVKELAENGRSVCEKCSDVLSALNDASKGTHALENAAATVSSIIADLDTTIMFANAGTLSTDEGDVNFADHRENILRTAKALVEDTKTLVAGAASSQEQLAVAAQNAVTTIVQLSEVVKTGASSLGPVNKEAQVMLINSVKDVASALGDLMQSTKSASGKNIQDPAMHKLKDSAKIMVTNVTTLLKTVKVVEDKHTRGTRALESAIEAITQELKIYDSSTENIATNLNRDDGSINNGKASPEDLISATRPITLATSRAVGAGQSGKQEDIIVAANSGRKCISDMLMICKSVALTCKNTKCSRDRVKDGGRNVAREFRDLLQYVHDCSNSSSSRYRSPSVGGGGASTMTVSSEMKQNLIQYSRKIAEFVTELATSSELLKDDENWVDPNDANFIAENELLGAARSINNAAAKLANLKPRQNVNNGKKNTRPDSMSQMQFDELILEAAKAIAAATAALIKAASEAQKDIALTEKKSMSSNLFSSKFTTEDNQWSEGLVSAARLVAAATHNMCEAANALVQGLVHSEEKLISGAKQVAGSTARLLIACKVKTDPESVSMRRLESASNAVRKATDNLVSVASEHAKQSSEDDQNDGGSASGSAVNCVVEEINARSEVLRMERELEHARTKLEKLHQRKYQTDSENEHSGYESSGCENFLHNAYSSTSKSFYESSSNQQQSTTKRNNMNSSIVESGPTFNQSMQHFVQKVSTSSNESTPRLKPKRYFSPA